MFQIAAEKYLPHLKKYKSVTDKVYAEIGDHFRGLYGGHAGWAHSVLFSADLRQFRQQAGDAAVVAEKKKMKKRPVKKLPES